MKNSHIIIIGLLLLTGVVVLNITKPDANKNASTITKASPTVKGTQTMDVAELKIEDIQVGTGAEAKSGDTVVMHYNGTLLDGTKFDSSYDRGTPFETQIGVGQVIEGWDKGVPGMKVGGKRKLTIPSSLGYGPNGIPGVIPPASALVFEVELVDIR